MSDISAKDVMELRKATGAGMMDAKRALVEAEGDTERAKDLLREQGLADAKKRSERTTDQGTIGHYLHFQAERPVLGVLVDLACETDFVAKSEEFQETAKDLAMHIAAYRPQWIRIEDVPSDVVAKERELIGAQARNENKPEHIIDKIVDGRVESFYADNVLYSQKFVNAEKFDGTVEALLQELVTKLGENISVRRFERMAVGETAPE